MPLAISPMSQAANAMSQAVSITRLTVRDDRVIAEVQVVPHAPHDTTAALMRAVLQTYPQLPLHACVNECGTTFRAVMNSTPLPHLLEHMVVDLQVRAYEQLRLQPDALPEVPADACFVGTSEWVCEQKGRARVAVSFADDLVALAAFKQAATDLNALLGELSL